MKRGEIWWAALPPPVGSEPGFHRPVLVVQADEFTRSRIATVTVAAVTSNLALAEAPGNVSIPRTASRLPRDSVVNVSQLLTVDKAFLAERVGRIPAALMEEVDDGLRLALAL